MTDPSPLRVAVLVSGEGTTLQALLDAVARRELSARIVLVASDRPSARALERARDAGVATAVFPPKEGPPGAWAGQLSEALQGARAELVVEAGFLRILPPSFLERWAGRVINLHPSLLPKFGGMGMYGSRVFEAVVASGDPETGASVHLATSVVDGGPVLAQRRIPTRPGESARELAERQRPVEHALLIEVVARFARRELPLPPPGGPR